MAKLVGISNSVAGLSYELGRQWVTIGRGLGNGFQVVESSISAQHCEVLLRETELIVRDMRSTNGTFVRGALVSEAVVQAGEIFRIGDVEFRFDLTVFPSPSKGDQTHPSKTGTTQARRHQVLLVDDSMAFLETVGELFETLGDKSWQIHRASAADKALQILQQHPIELAIFDINMPLLDGGQLLGIAHRRYPEVKKVILTGNASENLRTSCLANGAELFLEKPTSPDGMKFVFNVLNDLIEWHLREGFYGTLRQVGLTDVVQIQCLGRHSCILEVNSLKVRGEIYIEQGVIVHALAGRLSGEEALHQLLSLNGGDFFMKQFVAPSDRSVRGEWEMLLMEAARARDEDRISRADEDTVHLTKPETIATSKHAGDSHAPDGVRDEIKTLGDNIVVVSTYDGKWHPAGGVK